MRRLRYSVAMSLDGYIADREGGFDWIMMDPAIDFEAYLSKIDALIMGRLTYELASGAEGGVGFDGMESYVVSTTLDPDGHPNVTIVPGEPGEFVADLKAKPGKDIWLFGGGLLFRSLLEAGMVDRVEVGVIPVLLGDGVPLLPGLDRLARLQLHSVEEFPSGIVLIKYDLEARG